MKITKASDPTKSAVSFSSIRTIRSARFVLVLLCMTICIALLAGCSSSDPAAADEDSDENFSSLKSFTAETLDGGEFTQEDLAGADAAAIYCWQTG